MSPSSHAADSWIVAGLAALPPLLGMLAAGPWGLSCGIALSLVSAEAARPMADRAAHGLADAASPCVPGGVLTQVTDLSRRAGLPAPRVVVLPSDIPRAFAAGHDPSHAVLAINRGLLDLPRDEIAAALAHEIAHVRLGDPRRMALATALAAVTIVAGPLAWGMLGGRLYAPDPLGSLLMLVIAPLAAALLLTALARTREYCADAEAARLHGQPEVLAAALERMDAAGSPEIARALFSTSPPTRKRAARLRALRRPL